MVSVTLKVRSKMGLELGPWTKGGGIIGGPCYSNVITARGKKSGQNVLFDPKKDGGTTKRGGDGRGGGEGARARQHRTAQGHSHGPHAPRCGPAMGTASWGSD